MPEAQEGRDRSLLPPPLLGPHGLRPNVRPASSSNRASLQQTTRCLFAASGHVACPRRTRSCSLAGRPLSTSACIIDHDTAAPTGSSLHYRCVDSLVACGQPQGSLTAQQCGVEAGLRSDAVAARLTPPVGAAAVRRPPPLPAALRLHTSGPPAAGPSMNSATAPSEDGSSMGLPEYMQESCESWEDTLRQAERRGHPEAAGDAELIWAAIRCGAGCGAGGQEGGCQRLAEQAHVCQQRVPTGCAAAPAAVYAAQARGAGRCGAGAAALQLPLRLHSQPRQL